MSATDEQIRHLITQRAADWFVMNRAGMTKDQRQSFTDWLKTSPVHVEEYLAITVIGRDLRQACAASAESLDALIERARSEADSTVEPLWPLRPISNTSFPRAWRFAAIALSIAVLVTGSLVALRELTGVPPATLPAAVTALHYQTRHGQQQTYVLADHSVVHLNTDSEVTIRYSQTQRLVDLTAGEAAFEVTHESARPFRVTAQSAEIFDLGTQFVVRLRDAATVVTVVEGGVEVRSFPASSARTHGLQVTAGQQVSITDGNLPPAALAVDTGRATAWLHRQISFDREPLGRVAAEFNRYATKSIEISTPALRNLQISGIFTTDDTAAFIAFLRSLEGVQVEETATQIIVSRAR